MTEKELLQLKSKIDQAKTKLAELSGEKQALLRQLKENWNCASVKEAEVLLEEKQMILKKLTAQIDADIQILEEKYFTNES